MAILAILLLAKVPFPGKARNWWGDYFIHLDLSFVTIFLVQMVIFKYLIY